MKRMYKWIKTKNKQLEVINIFITITMSAIIACCGNRLVRQQNEIAKMEFSPAINVVRAFIYNDQSERYDTIEIQVYNLNFPVCEFSGKGQCILRFYTNGGEKDYLLDGVFFANVYSSNTTGLLLRSYEPNNNWNTVNYINKCLENCEEVTHIEVHYYYKFEYKDAFDVHHERYYDLSDPAKAIELDFQEGKTLFELNSNLESLDYNKDYYPKF